MSSSSSSSSSSNNNVWGFVKPLLLGHSATNNNVINNMLAQTIAIGSDPVSISKTYCYLYAPPSNIISFSINMGIYLCDENGKPVSLLKGVSIPSSIVTEDGWYEFDFETSSSSYVSGIEISSDAIENGYISFVISQSGGDENNYVLWGYTNKIDNSLSKAFLSNDGVNWQTIQDTCFAIKVISGNDTLFDLGNYRIVSEPATLQVTQNELVTNSNSNSNSTIIEIDYTGTKYVPAINSSPNQVIVDNPNLFMSFVVDGSGSMGWNDRFQNRINIAEGIINQLNNTYPKDVLFDAVSFGAVTVDTSGFTQTGTTLGINLDARNPTRTSYTFTAVSNATVYKNDIYTNNETDFTVFSNVSNNTTIICTGTLSPLSSGTLTKVSGLGDSSIVFNNVIQATVDNSSLAACGFKNFIGGKTYNICSIQSNGVDLVLPNSPCWQMFNPVNESPTMIVSNNGPDNGTSLDVSTVSDNLVIRNPFFNKSISTSGIVNNVSTGDTSVIISNSNAFSVSQRIDLVDGNNLSFGHIVSNVSSLSMQFSPSSYFDILNYSNDKGIVQYSSFYNPYVFNGTTITIYVRDVNVSSEITTFFFQTTNGTTIEWDFNPFSEWENVNLYWLGQTAAFDFNLLDSSGNPLTDGTRVDLYVDTSPVASDQTTVSTSALTEVANVGDSRIYVAYANSFSIDEDVIIVDNSHQQNDTVLETGVDNIGAYIDLYEPLEFEFDPANGAKISAAVSNSAPITTEDLIISSPLSLIDVTPIVADKSIDPSLLAPYDPPPLDPSTSYDEVNKDIIRTRNLIQDTPSINGYSAIRVLPITEDILTSNVDKAKKSANLLKQLPPSLQSSQIEQNTGDFTTTIIPESGLVIGSDYTIQSPIYLEEGYATSKMTSSATQFKDYIIKNIHLITATGYTDIISARKYVITPTVTPLSNQTANSLFTVNGSPFDAYFAPQYLLTCVGSNVISSSSIANLLTNYDINSDNGTGYVTYYKPKHKFSDTGTGEAIECLGTLDPVTPYITIARPGAYASSGNSYYLIYTLTDEFVLMNNTSITINLYSNTVVDLETMANADIEVNGVYESVPFSQTVLNYLGSNASASTSSIVSWRNAVQNNPVGNILPQVSNVSTQIASNSSAISSMINSLNASIQLSNSSSTSVSTNTSETNIEDLFHPTPPTNFYETPENWQLIGTVTIPVVNGHAVYTVPSQDTPALLFIEAIYSFGNGLWESINNNFVIMANPLMATEFSPSRLTPLGDGSKFEIGNQILWMNNAFGTIENGTIEKVIAQNTQIVPDISETIDGNANGLFIGPHAEVPYPPQSDLVNSLGIPLICPKGLEQLEVINVNVTSNNYAYSFNCKRIIDWMAGASNVSSVTEPTLFTMYCTQESDSFYADGSISQYPVVTIDLNDGFNSEIQGSFILDPNATIPTIIQEYVGNGVPYILGLDQPNNQSQKLISNTCLQSPAYFSGGVANLYPNPINANVGFSNPSKYVCGEVCPNSWIPEYINEYRPRITTHYTDSFGSPHSCWGTYIGLADYDQECLIEHPPTIEVVEPLSISSYSDAYNNIFLRDGSNSVNVVFECYWKGSPIRDQITINSGAPKETVINYPLPIVLFEAGVAENINSYSLTSSSGDTCTFSYDIHAPLTAYLSVNNDSRINLNTYTVQSGYLRTTRVLNHTHSCTVDTSGNGITTSTIVLSGSIADHTHNISNYNTDTVLGHVHEVACVAITTLLPTTDATDIIAVIGTVLYDPTAVPSGEIIFTQYPNCHRYMKDSVNFIPPSLPPSSQKVLKIEWANTVSSVAYTSINPYSTDFAFNLTSYAYFESNVTGTIIDTPVIDGTRITTEIQCYLPPAKASENTSLNSVESAEASQGSQVIDNDYLVITAKAYVYSEGQYAETDYANVKVESALQWIPTVKSLITEPTDNAVTIIESLNNVAAFGSSQLYDAVTLAANRMIDFNQSNSAANTFSKVMVILSDGDENADQNSIEQAIATVNSVEQKNNTQIASILLGSGYASDNVIMIKLANETNGLETTVRNLSSSGILSLINDILSSSTLSFNNGTYRIIEKVGTGMPIQISLENTNVPTGTTIEYCYRTSTDGINWTQVSDWINYSTITNIPESIDNIVTYYEYTVRLISNSSFQSPYITEGVGIKYLEPTENIVFFKPNSINRNSLEYMASVLITHAGTIPNTSTVTYGLTQSESTNPNDYTIAGNDLRPDKQEILLSRYNELLITADNKIYQAINGSWPMNSTINVYKYNSFMQNGELVNSATYSSNYINGTISFITPQEKSYKFIICIEIHPVFNLICKIKNYGTIPATIDHIGLIYNVAKRIPTLSNGTIINKNIADRI